MIVLGLWASNVQAQVTYSEVQNRISQKRQQLDTVQWLKKREQLLAQEQRRPEAISLKDANQSIDQRHADYIGPFLYEDGGFGYEVWEDYERQNLIQDFSRIIEIYKEQGLYPSQRDAIAALLLTPAAPPSGFSENSFTQFRINQLLSLGMPREALDLYHDFLLKRKSDNADLHILGLQVFLYNNEYEPACLYLKQSPEASKKQGRNFFNELERLCQARLNLDEDRQGDLPLNDLHNYPSLFAFYATLSANAADRLETHIENEIKQRNVSLLYALSKEPAYPLQRRLALFKQGLAAQLYSPQDLDMLYEDNMAFAMAADQRYLPEIRLADNNIDRLEAIEKQILLNENPARAESKYYQKYLIPLKTSDFFLDQAWFLYRFFALTEYHYKGERWQKLLSSNSDSINFNDLIKEYEKKLPFFIFPLAPYKNFMLQVINTLDSNMKNDIIIHGALKSAWVESLENQCFQEGQTNERENCPWIETVTLKNFNADKKKIVDRFEKATAFVSEPKEQKAEAITLSIILWYDVLQHSQNDTDLKKNINFILHRLHKSVLYNYVFALNRDYVIKR